MNKKHIKSPIKKGVAKVPVVMQLEALECGAACLAMVMAYYEKWVPLEKVRIDCGVSRDGSNAKNMLSAAQNYGFNVKGFRYSPSALREKGTFPCIIHWEFNHFVVLDGFRGNKAYINDPAKGTYSVSAERFDEAFTGVCLTFAPNENFEPGGKPKSVLEFAASRLKGAGPMVAFVVLTTAISALIGVIQPAFSRIFMDRLLTHKNPQWLMPLIGVMAAIAVVQFVTLIIESLYSGKINGKLAVVGNTTFLWKVLHMPMEFFSQRMAGSIQGRQETNATIAKDLVETVAPLFINAIMMIFYLVVMMRYSVGLTLIGIVSIIINVFISRLVSKQRVNITRVQMGASGQLAAATVAGIEMIETIKASGAENGYFEKWAAYQASVNTQKQKFSNVNIEFGMLPSIINVFSSTIILVIGVWLTMRGDFTVGMIMAFQGFLSAFSTPTTTLISAGQTIQEMSANMERVDDVMKYPEDVCYSAKSAEQNFAKLNGNIEIKNVTFGYSPLAKPLINNFNMTIKPGQSIALVGTSGCGKSTISKLISGLYQPWSGEILYDGKLLLDIDRNVFTSSIAVVDQDIILFEDTIANNIKMWDTSIEDFEMILAARDAQLHETIMQRDGGYSYQITEGGKDFSGGQRQRMEIARVLAQDPHVVILDEATSALDAKTESEVVRAIKRRGITCIVVAHRLSTIRDCDEILVLDHGAIVERGTHQELYTKGGKYTELLAND